MLKPFVLPSIDEVLQEHKKKKHTELLEKFRNRSHTFQRERMMTDFEDVNPEPDTVEELAAIFGVDLSTNIDTETLTQMLEMAELHQMNKGEIDYLKKRLKYYQ